MPKDATSISNTVILLTSNVGTELIEHVQGPGPCRIPMALPCAARAAAQKVPGGAARTSRRDPRYQLSDASIVRLQLDGSRDAEDHHKIRSATTMRP